MNQNTMALAGGRVREHRTLFLITVAFGVLLNPLNSSMIAVALARMESVFHLGFTTGSWLISSYYLASAISQPVMGKIGDVLGRKRMFILGIILVAVSCVSAPFSRTFLWLIVLRLIQSIGSGAIYPAGMGIVREYVSERQAKALAFLAVFSSGAAAFGPSIGGFAMHVGDWPAIFWVNIPFLVIGLILAIWFLPNDKNQRQQNFASQFVKRLDLPGIFLFTISIVGTLVFLLSFTERIQWWGLIAAGIGFTLFFLVEQRVAFPFLNPKMFRENIPLSWVLIQFVIVNVIFYSIFFGMPSYLEEIRKFDAEKTGLIMLCVAGLGVIISPIAGRWIEKSGSRPPLILAGICMTTGSLLFLTLHLTSPIWWLAINLCVLGVSGGFNNVGLQTALFRVSPEPMIGVSSGLFQMARYMGTIFSTVLLGVVFGNHLSTDDLHTLGMILAALGMVVIFLSIRLPERA